MQWVPYVKNFLTSGLILLLVLGSESTFAEEILDSEHSHYRQQILRIEEALEKGKKENDQQSLLDDARRTTRWIFSEPEAAETEEKRMSQRIDKQFFGLNLPNLIHPLPVRPFLFQKTTAHSSLVTNFESGTITARVTVPYFEDSGLIRARNEAVFLSILLLRDGILSLPVQNRLPLSRTVPPEAGRSGGMIEQYIISRGITQTGLSIVTHKLAAGGGIALARISFPIPLHIGDRLALEIERSEVAPPLQEIRNTTKVLPPTGLILDLRRVRIRPFRDPIIISESRHPLMIPDQGRPSDSLPYGWAGWSDGLDTEEREKRVGLRPLIVRPAGFIHRQVFVLSLKDAKRVQRELFPTKLLTSGHILILVDPQQLIQPPSSPLKPKGSRL